jgi:hypothetical protein
MVTRSGCRHTARVAVRGGEPPGLDQQPLAQPVLSVHGGDRVQPHHGQQPPFRGAGPDGLDGYRSRGLMSCHVLAFPRAGLAGLIPIQPRTRGAIPLHGEISLGRIWFGRLNQ